MPAAFRTTLRPPSQPTRYAARNDSAVGQLDVDAGVVLRETRHLTSAMDRHLELADPVGQDPLDVVLPQPESVGVPGGEVADVQGDPGEPCDLSHLSLRQEPVGDPTLVEDLDGARVQAAGARTGEVLTVAPLDDANVDPRQRQLARQHQPRRASSGDHHRVLGHRHMVTPLLWVPAPESAIMRHDPGLAASPHVGLIMEVEGKRVPASPYAAR